jgi:hypothetical protein
MVNGDKTNIENLLTNDPSLIANSNLLYYAIDEEKVEIIQYLIDKGVDVNQIRNGISPLIYVSTKVGKTDLSVIVTLLLENGADINYQDESGNTALIAAAKFQVDILKMSTPIQDVMIPVNFSIMLVMAKHPLLNKDIEDNRKIGVCLC